MLNRKIIRDDFLYKTNEFNFRSGFMEETGVKKQTLFNRIDHWKNIFIGYCKLNPQANIQLHFNQTSLDTLAVCFAAIECDFNIVDKDPELIIHTLADSELNVFGFDQYKNYNYFDLADLKFSKNYEYKQKGTSLIFDEPATNNFEQMNIQGNILHTRYTSRPLLSKFLFPSLCTPVQAHFSLGYNDMKLGIDKIAHVVQKYDINCVFLPTLKSVEYFRISCQNRGVDLQKVKIISYDNGVCESKSTKGINIEKTLSYIPDRFNIDGEILSDNNKLYFKFNFDVDPNVAEVKVKSINSYLKAKYKKQIVKWAAFTNTNNDDSLLIFRKFK